VITLQLADLVVIASRVLELDTAATLDLLDLTAAETALAATPPGDAPDDPASRAAVLLHALVRQQPFRRGNQQIALTATLQFLALNGWQADLDPPEAAKKVVAELAAGTLEPAGLADWLTPRLRPCDEGDTCAKEIPMRRWLPRRKRPAQPKDRFARFTDRARRVMVLVQEEARLLNHNYIGTEHLLLGLIREGEGVAAKALASSGISLEAVRAQVEGIIGQGQSAPTGHIPFTPRAKKVLELSLREALQLGHNYIGTEHLLLGLIREGEGVAAQVLVNLGAGHARLRKQVLRLLADGTPTSPEEGELPSGPAGRQPSDTSAAPDLAYYDQQLADVRRAKDAAIAAQEFDTAATLRVVEKQLLDRRAQREQIEQIWTAGVDVGAVVEENQRLHRQVERLQGLLRQHGIEPDGGTSQTA
jgi:Clp amino terminal domain, pathogenicity island component